MNKALTFIVLSFAALALAGGMTLASLSDDAAARRPVDVPVAETSGIMG